MSDLPVQRLRCAMTLLLCLSVLLPLSTMADSFEDRQRILVGVRSDAKPFSYRTRSRADEAILTGYGGYMVEICRRVLADMVIKGPFQDYPVIPVDITSENRFDVLSTGAVDLLCGPDSITLGRLRIHAASHPLFLSGLTYISVDNDQIPLGRYCKGVVGLVRGTTAESVGLELIADSRELARFNEPLEVYLSMSIAADDEEAARRNREAPNDSRTVPPGSIRTQECPEGYEINPIVFYDDHITGVRELCAGNILFYVGDVDIVRKRVQSVSGCEPVMRLETLTREAYGVYFRQYQGEAVAPPADASSSSGSGQFIASPKDSVLYAQFNTILLQKMQATENILDYEYAREFGTERKTEDLRQFFDSFKFASHY